MGAARAVQGGRIGCPRPVGTHCIDTSTYVDEPLALHRFQPVEQLSKLADSLCLGAS